MTMTFLARAKIELEHTCMEKEQYSRVRYSDKVFLLHFFPILMSTLVGWSPPKLAGKMSEMQQCTCVWFASLPIMPRLSPKNNNNKNPFFFPLPFSHHFHFVFLPLRGSEYFPSGCGEFVDLVANWYSASLRAFARKRGGMRANPVRHWEDIYIHTHTLSQTQAPAWVVMVALKQEQIMTSKPKWSCKGIKSPFREDGVESLSRKTRANNTKWRHGSSGGRHGEEGALWLGCGGGVAFRLSGN